MSDGSNPNLDQMILVHANETVVDLDALEAQVIAAVDDIPSGPVFYVFREDVERAIHRTFAAHRDGGSGVEAAQGRVDDGA